MYHNSNLQHYSPCLGYNFVTAAFHFPVSQVVITVANPTIDGEGGQTSGERKVDQAVTDVK